MPSRGDRGFSLIEVMVALAVLGAGVLGVLGALTLASRVSDGAFHRQQVIALAEERMEILIHDLAEPGEQQLEGTRGRYQWQVELQERDHGLVRGVVRVAWTQRGEERTFALERIFAE